MARPVVLRVDRVHFHARPAAGAAAVVGRPDGATEDLGGLVIVGRRREPRRRRRARRRRRRRRCCALAAAAHWVIGTIGQRWKIIQGFCVVV